MLRNILPGLAVLAGSLVIGPTVVSAQQQSPLDQRNQQFGVNQRIDNTRGQQAELTEKLAGWLIMSNHSQVELGKLAAERTQREEVREYAQMMVNDHSQLLKQLQQFAPERENLADRDVENVDQMQQIGETAARYKLGLTQKLLEKFEGQDFDMGYLGQQLVAHVEMLATLEAMKSHGSPEFQQVVERGIEATKKHYQQNFMLSMKLQSDRGQAVGQTTNELNGVRDETRFAPRTETNRTGTNGIDINRFETNPAPQNRPEIAPRPVRPESNRTDVDRTGTDSDLDLRLENNAPDANSDIELRPSIKEDDDSLDLEAEGDVQP